MKIFIFHTVLLFIWSLHATSCNKIKQKPDHPNIIIVFTDDQGYGDVGCYGAKGFETPHLDKLADNGIKFNDFYVAASVCTPSRAALLTGKYPKQLNLHEAVIFPYSEHGLAPKELTIAEMLKAKGYKTGIIGKWHLGHAKTEFMPNNHGFDYFYGVPYSNDMDGYYYKHLDYQAPPLPVYLNEKKIAEGVNQDSLTTMWTNAAVQFIKEQGKDPFFLYLPHSLPHLPWHVSDRFRNSSSHGLYGDIIQEIDWSVGEIISALEATGKLDNTLVIFTSDNGQQIRKNGGSAGPLRGGKAQTWEGGMRVPCIVSWPNRIDKGVSCSSPVSAMDLLPTIANLTGYEIAENSRIAGRNISPILFSPGKELPAPFELLFYNRPGNPEAIRYGDWKLHIAKSRGWNKEDGEFQVSLYKLSDDIGESRNLAERYPEVVKQLTDRLDKLDKWISEDLRKNYTELNKE